MDAQSHPRILIAGFGNMGRALVHGWLDSGMAAGSVNVAEDSVQARSDAKHRGLGLIDSIGEREKLTFDVLVLAVKPHQLDAALSVYADAVSATGVVLSIAAGRTIDSIQRQLPDGQAIVRSMPNTPAAIGRGVTVLCANDAASAAQRETCSELMRAVGAVYWVDNESMLDAVTAVSGSGPAYVFLLTESLIAAGVRQGLPAELAADLALHTVAGAGTYALDSQSTVSALREQVTSPGGTTEAALRVLMNDDAMHKLIDEAVSAAAARSTELSSEQK